MITYFAEIDPSHIDQNGQLNYPYLDDYWQAISRRPFFIELENQIVGFVLVNDFTVVTQFGANQSIAEFYIQPAYRRQGIGKVAAFQLFETFRDRWEVRQAVSNLKAQKFWRTIIREYTKGNFQEVSANATTDDQVIQLFTS